MEIKYIKPDIKPSDDGSNTLIHPLLGESYHSSGGAVGESLHIYINNGIDLLYRDSDNSFSELKILEMGFGSGLNALLTIEWAIKNSTKITYHTVELYPIEWQVIENMKYENFVSKRAYDIYRQMHICSWNEMHRLDDYFSAMKICGSLTDINFNNYGINYIDMVYFDAFAPDTQPELWSKEIFSSIYEIMNPASHLVTYSAKGIVKQALRDSGFTVKRLTGAMGKRHMLLAVHH